MYRLHRRHTEIIDCRLAVRMPHDVVLRMWETKTVVFERSNGRQKIHNYAQLSQYTQWTPGSNQALALSKRLLHVAHSMYVVCLQAFKCRAYCH